MSNTIKCNVCGRELPEEEFELEHTKKGNFRRHTCRECRAKYRKKWRKENPDKYHAQASRHQDRCTEWLHSIKTPCIVCGESEPVALDFHHLDPSVKEFSISKHRSRSKEWLSKEISKCVCVCANCHRKIHAGLIDINDYI